MVVGFRPGCLNSETDNVDPCRLFLGFGSELQFKRHFEESFVEVQQLVGFCTESDNVRFQFGFAFWRQNLSLSLETKGGKKGEVSMTWEKRQKQKVHRQLQMDRLCPP
jgi:hypothetical protein